MDIGTIIGIAASIAIAHGTPHYRYVYQPRHHVHVQHVQRHSSPAPQVRTADDGGDVSQKFKDIR